METETIRKLLTEEEDKIRKTVQAGNDIDRDIGRCVESISDELSMILLKYNSSHSQEKLRQSAASAEVFVIKQALDLLYAGDAVKEAAPRREKDPAAVIPAVIAAALCAAGMILAAKHTLIACALVAAALAAAYISGRIWKRERVVNVRAVIDTDKVWNALLGMSSAADEKIEELVAHSSDFARSGSAKSEGIASDTALLGIFGDLLEAASFGSGELALSKIEAIGDYLKKSGIELEEYDGENEEHFELMPSKSETITMRPAFTKNGRLLMAGRAVRPE